MNQFGKVKSELSNILASFSTELANAEQLWTGRGKEEEGLVSSMAGTESSKVHSWRDRLVNMISAVNREEMKVVFVGRTSNGKSTTINAILRKKILPSGVGHTTNCFCSLQGTDESEAYLVTDHDTKMNIDNIKQLAHALHPDHKDKTTTVDIYWPRSNCGLLRTDVVIMDSPGLDMDMEFDSFIDKKCHDADVFILVANAESVFTVAEKQFFERVNKAISRPKNIFIEYNRWDCTDQEDDDDPTHVDRIRAAHFNNARKFLVDELRVCDDEQVKDRVFFVSAKEALAHRITSTTPTTEAAKQRLEEFKLFEGKFQQCVSDTAIKTRFAQHIAQANEMLHEFQTDISTIATRIAKEFEHLGAILVEKTAHRSKIDMSMSEAKQGCERRIDSLYSAVREEVLVCLSDDLPMTIRRIVEGFDEYEFEHDNVDYYVRKLNEYTERMIVTNIIKATVSNINELITESATASMQELQLLVPRDIDLHQQVPLPHNLISLPYKHRDIADDFKPDVSFKFSLGWANLAPSILGSSAIRVTKMLLPSPVSSLLDRIPHRATGGETSVDAETAVRSISTIMRLLKSPIGAIAMAVASMTMSRSATIKLGIFAGCGYTASYFWERLTYSSAAMAKVCKRQYAHHIVVGYKALARTLSISTAERVQQDLNDHLSRLSTQVYETRNKISREIAFHEQRAAELRDFNTQNQHLLAEATRLEGSLGLLAKRIE